MKLLLDTHAFIWWDDDYHRLPEPVLATLRDPANTVYLSLVSIWEMQVKLQLGKLRFDVPLTQKVNDQVVQNGLQRLPIREEHIYGLETLPHHHRDPFDRLLIAQAQIDDLQLVTHDANIHRYNVPVLWHTT